MYFSKISLRSDAPLRELQKIQVHGYRLHMTIWKIMSDRQDAVKREFLYRLETNLGRPFFYVVSAQPPADDRGVWQIATRPYDPVVREGERYSFVLRANAVRTPNQREHPRKRPRVDIVLEAQRQLQKDGVPRHSWPSAMQMAQEHGSLWLQQRGESCGFAVVTAAEGETALIAESYERQKFVKQKSKDNVVLSVVDFRGVLQVTNPIVFREKLMSGIGRGKAFGCGLLLVRRA